MKYFSLIALIIIVLISCEKDSKDIIKPKYGELTGYVKDEFGNPIREALVQAGPFTALSDYNGKYSFKSLPVQTFTVTASKKYFISKTLSVDIAENKISQLDFTLNVGETYINISDTLFRVTSKSGYVSFYISSNAEWVVRKTASWIKCSEEKGGKGDNLVFINYQENRGDLNRIDTVQFIAGSVKKTVIIDQSYPIKLLKFKGIIGNGELNINDSVYVQFNKPVKVNSIVSNWNLCVSDLTYNQIENGKALRFTYGCAELGGNYPFTISVSDYRGETFSQKIDVPFYDDILNLNAAITCIRMVDEKNECWISTRTPNRLIRVSLDNFKILQTINLDFYPKNFVVNPYNNNLYVLSGWFDVNHRIFENSIYIYNQQAGSLIKKITILPEADDHPQAPMIYPYDIGFTKNGYGTVLLAEKAMSGLKWKVIDSSKGDTLYHHENYGIIDIDDYAYFRSIHLNNDKSKLIMTGMYGSCGLFLLDENTKKITNLIPSSITRGVFIVPNRKTSKIYCGQLYDQFIMDVDGSLSKISYLDNRNEGSADFSYRDGEDGIIYFWDENYLRIMDYNNASTPMWCDALYGLQGFTTSIDGKYAYVHSETALYKFNTAQFYKTLPAKQIGRHNSSRSSNW